MSLDKPSSRLWDTWKPRVDTSDPFQGGVVAMGTVVNLQKFRAQAHDAARRAASVMDLATGRELPGVPSKALYEACVQPDGAAQTGAFAYHREGEWLKVDPRDRDWHAKQGHDVRFVRVLLGASDV